VISSEVETDGEKDLTEKKGDHDRTEKMAPYPERTLLRRLEHGRR